VKVEPIEPYVTPLRKSVAVPLPVPDAFDLFTTEMDRWWPLRTHSVHGDRASHCGIEPRIGGEIYEVARDGARSTWGRVIVWDPPSRVAFTWHPGRDATTAQEVEVTFRPVGTDTVVDLEHRGWQMLAERAAAVRDQYDNGWESVLRTGLVDAAVAKHERNEAHVEICHDVLIDAAPVSVFEMVSTAEGLDRWWTRQATGEPRVGEVFRLFFAPAYDWLAVVTRCHPPSEFELLVTRADGDWIGTRVTFELTRRDTRTLLRFRHAGWPVRSAHWRQSSF